MRLTFGLRGAAADGDGSLTDLMCTVPRNPSEITVISGVKLKLWPVRVLEICVNPSSLAKSVSGRDRTCIYIQVSVNLNSTE